MLYIINIIFLLISYLFIPLFYLFFLLIHPPPISTLFPYTTLFRSDLGRVGRAALRQEVHDAQVRQREDRVEEESDRSEEHTSELQSPDHLVCRLLLEKKK